MPLCALGQDTAYDPGASIYTCVDRSGRTLTSDRPIAQCLDREQRELSPSGVTRRIIPPSLTGEERARADARAQEEAELKAKQAEERRRDRALLARYSNRKQHDDERRKQLASLDNSEASIMRRSAELREQKNKLGIEMEFYSANPDKAPAWLKHRLKDNADQQLAQKRQLAGIAEERERINARFDEELTRLKPLWAYQNGNGAR